MDELSEKFSVFDCFNLIIVGTVFVTTLGVSRGYDSIILLQKAMKTLSEMIEAQSLWAVVIFVILVVLLVIGMVFQVIASATIEKSLKSSIKENVKEDAVFDNPIRKDMMLKKAQSYFGSEEISNDQIHAFYIHCFYCLRIKGLDKKIEQLHETGGLSSVLAVAFWAAAVFGCIFAVYSSSMWGLIACIVNAVLGVIFYERYVIAYKNRVRIVFSTYMAYIENETSYLKIKENINATSATSKEHGGKRKSVKKRH